MIYYYQQKTPERIHFMDIFSLICIMFAASVCLNDSLNPIALYVAIPCAFIWSASQYNILHKNPYIKILTILYAWICLCYPFAENTTLANMELKRILGAYILCFSIASLATKRKIIPWLYIIYIILLGAAWWYAKNNILTIIDFGNERLNDDKLNANTLAYYTFYVTIAIYILGEILKGKKRTIFRILLFGVVLLSFITAIYTGSRQVLIIQGPLLAALCWIRYITNSSKSILIILIAICIGIYAFKKYGADIYENSTLKKRSEIEVKDDTRYDIAVECLKIGVHSPLVGYGPGNITRQVSSHHGAHNTYLELFVNTGLPGVLIFIFMIYTYIKRQYKQWRHSRDKMFLIFIIFGLFWMIDQIFYSFYSDLWLMSFFILVASHSEQYYYSNYDTK